MTDKTTGDGKPVGQVIKFSGFVHSSLQKRDSPLGDTTTVSSNAYEPEDEYQQMYLGAARDTGIIQPPYVLRTLDRLSQENNTLGPCIEAMVTNVEGTGYDFESRDEASHDATDDSKIDQLKQFFEQPWPSVSFIAMRKELRRDLGRVGNAYLEVLRNAQDQVVFVRHVDAKMMRILRLDEAVPVDVQMLRNGKMETVKVMQRERRYCQLVNGVSLVYFKEFGAKRDLNKKNAVWSVLGARLPANQRATEIIHFTSLPDSHTPYGVPVWVNQIPSIIGSRKAEEFNLEFFDNGGVPPVIILLQGGTLQADTRKALEQKTSGLASANNRVQVIEVEPNGGSLDNTPQARVTVERFGGDRTSDSMFEKYDERCEIRVRRSFRLPPIFLGQSHDYAFATAFTSYVMAEAQVFKPEREEFDEIITMRLLPALGFPEYRMRSKPLVLEDATLKLQGIEVAMNIPDQVEPADIITAINEVTGLHMKISDAAMTLADRKAQANQISALPPGATHTMDSQGNIAPINPMPLNPANPTKPQAPGKEGQAPGELKPKKPPVIASNNVQKPVGSPSKKSDNAHGVQLAMNTMQALRKRDFVTLAKNMTVINSLDEVGRANFSEVLTGLAFIDPSYDPEGLAELSACTLAVMSGQHTHQH